MSDHAAVNIVMIEDDEGHARLIEKNIRRAGISNSIHHFTDGGSALSFLYDAEDGPVRNGPALILLDLSQNQKRRQRAAPDAGRGADDD